MKLKYQIPDVQVVTFEVEDVITTSPESSGLTFGGNLDAETGGDSIHAGDLFN